MAVNRGIHLAVIVAACIVTARPVYAYLDPGTGSIILQSILAGVAVVMGVLRLYWYRIKSFLGGANGKSQRPADQDEHEFVKEAETRRNS